MIDKLRINVVSEKCPPSFQVLLLILFLRWVWIEPRQSRTLDEQILVAKVWAFFFYHVFLKISFLKQQVAKSQVLVRKMRTTSFLHASVRNCLVILGIWRSFCKCFTSWHFFQIFRHGQRLQMASLSRNDEKKKLNTKFDGEVGELTNVFFYFGYLSAPFLTSKTVQFLCCLDKANMLKTAPQFFK